MIGIIARAALALGLVFGLLLLGILALQSNDDMATTLLLGTDACDGPCFLGIQPGITPVTEARLTLEAHPWISAVDIEFSAIERSLDRIVWSWSGQQPAIIDGARPGVIIVGPERDLIGQVRLPTRLRLGEVHLLVGQPPFFTVGTSQFGQPQLKLEIEEFHVRHGFYLHIETRCPLWMSILWQTTIDSITLFDSSGDLMQSYTSSPPTPLEEYRRTC